MLTGSKPYMLRLAAIVLLLLAAVPAYANPSMVVDVATGKVLHAEREFERWQPASLTKLMTAYITFGDLRRGTLTLKSPVRISLNAARNPPSHMAYPVGTIVTMDNALKMMLVKSANDIAVAIAESVSGTVEDFAVRMNRMAKMLGMKDSHFVNPNGLHESGQYTSAHDLAILARAIRREFPEYAHYFSTEALKDGDRVYDTYNILIGRFDGADGMKTGYICESGFNIVGSATRNGNTLIAVVLGAMSSKGRAERAADLLESGFAELDKDQDLPLLADLTPPEDHTDAVANVRSTVCSQEANDKRWANRSLASFDTPAMKPLTRDLVAVPIGIGGASGASRSAVMMFGRYFAAVPVPEMRPAILTDEVLEARRADGLDLASKRDIPIPSHRPDTGA